MSDTTNTKEHPTVKCLEAHRVRLGLNDTQFAQRLRVSPASWSTMRAGTYLAKDPAPMLERFEAALQQLDDQAASAATGGKRAEILPLRYTRAAVTAVKRATGQARNRLIVYLARTGGGKTTLANHLSAQYLDSCVVVQATETWRDSYFAAVLAVARALGITEGLASARAAEAAVIATLQSAPRIVVVDEAHHGGKAALNLLKLILNSCPEVRVVVLAIPQLWDRMQQGAAQEAAQLRSRTFAKIVVPDVGAEDCGAFLAAKLPHFEALNGDEKLAIQAACDAANRFGLFDTLQRVCEDDLLLRADRLTLEEVVAAIRRVEALRS